MTARSTPREIPSAELEVLSALWRMGRATVHEVRKHLREQGRDLAYNTVQTLLSRLFDRECVAAERDGRAHVYRPTVSRKDVLSERWNALVRQFSAGRPMPLLLELVEEKRLSSSDLELLRRHLDQLEGEQDRPAPKSARSQKT
jgi:BlaI family penicillinase repressor